jgi:hypothetical protein
MESKIIYWIELSDYDVETADAMLKRKDICTSDLCVIKPLRNYSKRIISKQS